MRIYTVHVPDAATDPVTRVDTTVLVREGFSGRAFLFGLFYLLWHRMWFAAVLWAVLLALLAAFVVVIHPLGAVPVALLGLMHLYLGTTGLDLLRGHLDRRGRPLRDLVTAPDRDTAEAVFFARHPIRAAASAPRPSMPRHAVAPAAPAVIGLFPDGSGA